MFLHKQSKYKSRYFNIKIYARNKWCTFVSLQNSIEHKNWFFTQFEVNFILNVWRKIVTSTKLYCLLWADRIVSAKFYTFYTLYSNTLFFNTKNTCEDNNKEHSKTTWKVHLSNKKQLPIQKGNNKTKSLNTKFTSYD